MFEQLSETLSQPYFSWITKLQQVYPEAEVFLVGGAVRDAVLQRPTKDYDFVVRGVQARYLQDFLSKVGIVNLVGRTFGVFKFIPDEGYAEFKIRKFEAFDLALPRTESAWGTGGYRDVEVQSDHELPIEKDLGRRDFTVNAMALKLAYSEAELPSRRKLGFALLDPYGGAQDIKAKIIRAVGEPGERFREDYTRILRGLRMACELGFEIDKDTMAAIQSVIPAINDQRSVAKPPDAGGLATTENTTEREFVAPRETIATEFLRAFFANPVRAFDLCDASGAFEQLIPELLKMKNCPQPEEYHSEGDVWAHTRLALEKIHSPEFKQTFPNTPVTALLVMAVLFHDIGKPPMLKTPEADATDRIRFSEHDTVGAQMAREIAERLKLSVMPEHKPLHIDYDKLRWLIEHHLILLQTKAEEFKASTVEKYFFNERVPGEVLLQLMFCDGSASVPEGTLPDLQNLFDMQARIKRMESMVRGRQGLPKPLLNGNEIMEILKIPPGTGVGEIIRELREEQLSARINSKEEAIAFMKEKFGI